MGDAEVVVVSLEQRGAVNVSASASASANHTRIIIVRPR